MSPVDFTHANAGYLVGFQKPEIFRRVSLAGYYPPFRDRLVRLKHRALLRGHAYWSEFGYRSMAQQQDLRTRYVAGLGGKAAPAGLSAHQYGLADDSTHDSDLKAPGLQPDWLPANYLVLAEEAAREGLDHGHRYGDDPHVGWPGFVTGAQLETLLTRWNAMTGTDDERLRAIWAYLDTLPAPAVP